MSFAQEIFSKSGGEMQEKPMGLVQSNLIACLGAIRQNDYDKAKIYFRQTLELWTPEIDLAGAEEEVLTPTIFARRFLVSKTLGAAYAFLTDEHDKALFYLEAAAKEDPADQEVQAWLTQFRKQLKLKEKKPSAPAPQNSEQLLKLAMVVILFLLVVIAVLGIFAILALRSEPQGSVNASLVSNGPSFMPNLVVPKVGGVKMMVQEARSPKALGFGDQCLKPLDSSCQKDKGPYPSKTTPSFAEGSQATKMAGLTTIPGASLNFDSVEVFAKDRGNRGEGSGINNVTF